MLSQEYIATNTKTGLNVSTEVEKGLRNIFFGRKMQRDPDGIDTTIWWLYTQKNMYINVFLYPPECRYPTSKQKTAALALEGSAVLNLYLVLKNHMLTI